MKIVGAGKAYILRNLGGFLSVFKRRVHALWIRNDVRYCKRFGKTRA